MPLEAGRGQIHARGKFVKGDTFVGLIMSSGLRLELDVKYIKTIAFEVKLWG